MKRYEAVFDRGWQHGREEAGYDEEVGGVVKMCERVCVCGTMYHNGKVVWWQFYQNLMHKSTTKKAVMKLQKNAIIFSQ